MLSSTDLGQIKSIVTDIVQETVLDSEKRIRKDMANMKNELLQFTQEGVDQVVQTLEIMFPEKSPHLKSKSQVIA